LGRSISDIQYTTENAFLPFLIDKSENNNLAIKLIDSKDRKFAPEEVLGSILHRLKMIAEKHLHAPVSDAVISVPACFNSIQRQAVLDAGKIADLKVLGLINEPTAALIGHGFPNGAIKVSDQHIEVIK
jgi:molecular chaperone DnaK (HSP70)